MTNEQIELLANIAYTTYTTRLFGVPPGIVHPHRDTGFAGQTYGSSWEKLPKSAKEAWRSVVRAIEEHNKEQK